VWGSCPKEGTSFVRGHLGRMLFSGEDVTKKVGSLSGGEAARLIFCRIVVEKPNLLILDEPTNHLDLEAIAALVEGLKKFEGTVLFVSHDRWFVSELATRVLEVTPDGPRDFPGTYQEYLERCGDDHLDADAVVLKAKGDAPRAAAVAEKQESALSWEEQKKRRNRLAALPARRDKVLAQIHEAEAKKKAIHDAWAAPGYFEKTPADEVAKQQKEDEELGAKIDAWMAEWEEIETELSSAQPEA
jgi:ABC-type multidrug transport system ATPase subunit